MFCIQCEQTINGANGQGCSYSQGACGKTAEVSDLQDVLVYALQSLSFWADQGRTLGVCMPEIDQWAPRALFSTLTNVNFDPQSIVELTHQTQSYRNQLANQVRAISAEQDRSLELDTPLANFTLPENASAILTLAPQVMVNRGQDSLSKDLIGLRLLCLYGLKGVAAYMEHARVLGQTDEQIYGQYHHLMAWLGSDPTDADALLQAALQIGQLNFQVMEMLDRGETESFGHPQPTSVNVKPVKGHCILVSGHDLHDLEKILQQTQGTGINVYTHGEMLPAHAYPLLHRHPHLVGNYGGAWQDQQREFAQFPGPIVMTSNCLINPDVGQYAERLFTRGIVGWPGVTHLEGDDFSSVVAKALEAPGFAEEQVAQSITIGFGRNALLQAAPAVVEQVRQGHIRHFFLVGGCDGAKSGRNYYSDFAHQAPEDTLVLTLGCGKYRFNKDHFGDINGIPRLLDVGQCNDAYAAIQLALALAKEFQCGINELPLTLVLSWFEQKAIVILLTLLALGVKGIHVGPTAPAFLTPNLIEVLQREYDLHLTGDPQQDLNTILAA